VSVPELTADEALELLEAGAATFVDVRDLGSFRAGHIPGALHVNDHNVRKFVNDADPQRTTVVYCYHGNSSLGGAAFFQSEGLADVYSMTGGFAAWHGRPTDTSPVEARPTAPKMAPPPPPQRAPRESRRRRWLKRIRSLSRPKN